MSYLIGFLVAIIIGIVVHYGVEAGKYYFGKGENNGTEQ